MATDSNPWLWPKVVGDIFGEDDKTLFVGIGTLLGNGFQQHYQAYAGKAVLGTGTGYGPPLQYDGNWKFYAVRGPLTAQKLGLDARLAATDGAALLRTVPEFLPSVQTKKYRVSYMPHLDSRRHWDWTQIGAQTEVHLIDPTEEDVEKTLAEIAASEVVLAEAMHGAIVADALRVPWIAVKMHGHILDFKWHDWCASLDLEYRPQTLEPLFSASVTADKVARRLKQLPVPLVPQMARAGVSGALRGRHRRARAARVRRHGTHRPRSPALAEQRRRAGGAHPTTRGKRRSVPSRLRARPLELNLELSLKLSRCPPWLHALGQPV